MDSWLSIYTMAPLLGWLFAHIAKLVIMFVESGGKKLDPASFFKSGGMPSSHSAVMIAVLVVLGARQGVDSAIFGLAVAVAAIVIYDAVNVRRSVGEQGEALLRLIGKPKGPFVAKGHTYAEVLAGSLVGAVVGVILLQIL